jgi:beta-lactamase regulating signal transducer with metallopeptidase domain
MLEDLLLQVINMSFIGGIVILFILIARIILNKTPKIFSYSLWAVALLRLIVPFSFESILSLIPINPEPVSRDILFNQVPQINTGITQIDSFVNSSIPAGAGAVYESVSPMQVWITTGSALWIAGLLTLLIYSLITFLELKRKLQSAAHDGDNVYISSQIETPFVLGIIKPKIYLPVALTASEKEYIILHERTHIKRFDHVFKVIGFLTLCIHWFNPLVWIAFYVSGKDMEMSCDESVIRQLGEGVKKDYSSSLLALATGRRLLGATPLAFGEGDTKGRIKNVINYKKPVFWVVVVAIIAVLAIGVGLMSNPQAKQLSVEEHAEQYVKEIIKGYENADYQAFKVVEHKITSLNKLATFEDLYDVPVELWTIEYRLKPDNIQNVMFAGGMNEIDGWITEDSSMGKPILVFSYQNAKPQLLGHIWTAEAGLSKPAQQETALRVFLENKGLLPRETYAGNHIVVKFSLSTGESSQLFLSQPVEQGDQGIWCVERWMDGNGGVYHVTPETDNMITEYYKELQTEADNGQKQWLLDPLQVAKEFINNYMGQVQVTTNDLNLQYTATVEDFMQTPESHFIGFISNFKIDETPTPYFHLEQIEWLTSDDTERLKELNIDPDKDMPNGFYIHNPKRDPMFLQVGENTQFNIINWGESITHKSVTIEEFKEYLEQYYSDFVPPFRVVTKGGYVQSITEQYVP